MWQKRWIWLVVVSLGGCLLLTGLWLLSPWFLWHLLPEQVVFKAVLKSDRRITTLVPGLTVVEPLLGASTQIGLAVTQDGQTTFIIRPTTAGYFSLRRELKSAGWQTQWYGPWLLAGQGGPAQHRSFWQASRGRWPGYNPLFIAEGTLPVLDKPVRAVATAVGPEWRIVVQEVGGADQYVVLPVLPAGQAGGRQVLPDRAPQLVGEETAELSLTGALLTGLPDSLKNTWNEHLRDKFGFTKTKPDFMAELNHYQRLQLTLRRQGARLAVFDENERWRAAVRRWVEEEERQWRIQKRSFRLPDGTFGVEYVPGPRQAVFTPSIVHSNCSEAMVQERHFWLCGKDYSLFTSAEDLLVTLPPPTAVEIILGKNFLPALAQKKLQAATVMMGGGETLVRLLWQSKR